MSIFLCKVCGHIEFNSAPDKCPVCFAPKTSFKQNDNIFTESAEKSKEGAVKHIPAIQVVKKCGLIPEETCTDILVRIGEKLHPMEEKHHIMYIDCYIDKKFAARIHLTPEKLNPAGALHLKVSSGKFTAVERCNIHGAWINEVDI